MVRDHHAGYYPGARELVLKLVYERSRGRLLGGQAFGEEGVEKRIDVLATALQGRLTLQDLAEVDLAYAPPYSSANDPAQPGGLRRPERPLGLQPPDHGRGAPEGAGGRGPRRPLVLDVRNLNEYEASHLRGALNVPVDELRFRLEEVPRDRPLVVHCRSGFRSHLALRILKQNGFAEVRNLTGGFFAARALGGFDIEL